MYYARFTPVYWIFFAAGMVLLLGSTAAGDKKRYYIEQGSRLYLNGSSNVNEFTCDCEDQLGGQVLDVERNGGYARFRNVELQLNARNFNCHNRKIDHDMQLALKASQYPHIKITLVDTWQNPKCLEGTCKEWFDVKANIKLTITNVTKLQTIPAQAKMLGPNRFQLRGENALQMSDFGISPPEAMFGMIKVNDRISFHFDLLVVVDEIQ